MDQPTPTFCKEFLKKKLDPKKTLLKKLSTKEEKYIDKDELVFKAFDNNYCVFEEDYEEWLKSCIKILLEKLVQ